MHNRYSKQFSPPASNVISSGEQIVFGQRVSAGLNCGPTTEKSSVKLHAPPGGKSTIAFF